MSRVRHIFRWDLDKTYLKTEFDTVRDLVRTARLTAEERENIPGSAALIRAIRDQTRDDGVHQIFFISGSPEQLRTVIEKKFVLDGFVPDGFVLKPAVSHLLRGRFRALRSQVGYKLEQLLRGRAEAPVGAQETLFGDDAESDAFIYSLYADLVAGKVDRDQLRAVLSAAGAYGGQVKAIEEALEWVVHESPVKRIIIHLDQRTPPITFMPFFPRVVPIYNHLQTAIVLYLDGTLSPYSVRGVCRELLDRYGFDVQRLTNLAEDIIRRRRSYVAPEQLAALAEALRGLDPLPSPTSDREAWLFEQTGLISEAIAERADHLRHRPLPAEPVAVAPRADYLALWAEDLERREEIKRAKKLAGKISREQEREAARLLEAQDQR